MLKKIVFSGYIFFVLLASIPSAEEASKFDPKSPVVSLGKGYQIFPEKSLGNGAYRNGDFVVSDADLAIFDIYDSPGGYLYAGVDSTNKIVLRYNGKIKARFFKLNGGYYQLILKNGTSKLYRVYKGRIQDLLPGSMTANGMVISKSGKGAFSHISRGETMTDNGVDRYRYTFKIHVVEPTAYQVINIQTSISDFVPKLKINWLSSSVLEYTLSDGSKKRIKYKNLTRN